jgi:hypothetical protein
VNAFTVASPQPWQVLQRGVDIEVGGTGAHPATCEIGVEVVDIAGGAACSVEVRKWETYDDGSWRVVARVPEGWWQVHVRCLGANDLPLGAGEVAPVGVGEVLVVAGQSYAVSCHEKPMRVTDSMERVTATSPELGSWRPAHDPQPAIIAWLDEDLARERAEIQAKLDANPTLRGVYAPDSAFCGSVWPLVGAMLVDLLDVPVGFVHVAVGASSVRHWTPGSQLFANLELAVAASEPRAVLWQQGESDALSGTSAHVWAETVVRIRDGLRHATSYDAPWLVAKSTHHPAAGGSAEAEEEIRRGVELLLRRPGFVAGPDTDMLRGVPRHRAPLERGGHFSERGQRAAALLWWQAIWPIVTATAGVRTP